MTPTETRELLEQALLMYRHQRRAGAEHVKAVTAVGASNLVITFTDGTMARAEITVRPAPEGGQG